MILELSYFCYTRPCFHEDRGMLMNPKEHSLLLSSKVFYERACMSAGSLRSVRCFWLMEVYWLDILLDGTYTRGVSPLYLLSCTICYFFNGAGYRRFFSGFRCYSSESEGSETLTKFEGGYPIYSLSVEDPAVTYVLQTTLASYQLVKVSFTNWSTNLFKEQEHLEWRSALKKSKVQVNTTNSNTCVNITTNGSLLEEVSTFKYMRAILTKVDTCSLEISTMLAVAMAAMTKLSRI